MLIKLQNDIQNTIRGGNVTLATFADYYEAFDTIDFLILLHKIHKLKFSYRLSILVMWLFI